MTSIKQKLSFSNSYPNSGTSAKCNVILNKQIDDFGFVDNKSMDFSIKLKSTASHLSCSGQISSQYFEDSVNLKKVTLENADLKMTSSNNYSSTIFSDLKDALVAIGSKGGTDESIKESIDSTITLFQTFNQGKDKITIKNTQGLIIDAGEGKDIIIGNKGNDILIGGEGSDKLTGGKGADMFSFDLMDFYEINDEGNVVYNNVVDKITDFNLKEHDVLNFYGLDDLSFYAKLADAKADNAHLFYIKGSGNIYLNMDTEENNFAPHVIIKLTGKPAVNADLTDWNYYPAE